MHKTFIYICINFQTFISYSDALYSNMLFQWTSFQYSSSLPVLSSKIEFQYLLDYFSNSFFIFPISSLTRFLFSQFSATYFTRVMYTNCQIRFLSFNFFVSEFLYRLSSVSFPSYYIPVFVSIIPVPVPSFAFVLSVSWFSVSMRCVCLFLAVSSFAWGSARWRHLRDGTWNPPIGLPSPPFLLFPFVANFLCYQPSFTFHSTL